MLAPKRSRALDRPGRIVVGVGGHLGDAVLATGAIASLHEHFPDAEIGVVASAAGRVILDGHPAVSRFHQLDHWKTDRAGRPMQSFWRWRNSERHALADIRRARFDVAIDLYPFFPNMSALFWRAGIGVRVGYTSGGGGPLLTLPLEWEADRVHTTVAHGRLLGALGIPPEGAGRYALAPIPPVDQARAVTLLRERGVIGKFVVIHPGAGSRRKQWSDEGWIALARTQVRSGLQVVITGAGSHESIAADRIAAEVPGTVSVVNLTPVNQLRAVLQRAQRVFSLDSAAGHLAAAEGVESVVLMTGISDPLQWRPLSPRSRVVYANVDCLPCFKPAGCPAMTCIRSVSVDDLLADTADMHKGR
jgi:ADP-heptose:LPS heptosyltransferase